MQLHCPHCGVAIPVADVDVATGTAKCRKCDELFSFSPRGDPSLGVRRPPPPEPALVPRAERFRIEDAAGMRVITWRWINWSYLQRALFCVVWDSCLIFWYGLVSRVPATSGERIMAVVFPLGHLAIGLGMTYTTIAGFFNSTQVTIGRSRLTIAHQPLPWPGNRSVDAAAIAQLFVGRTESNFHTSGIPRLQYHVSAMMRDGSKIRLITGFKEIGEAKFLEQEIENFLHIAPQAVVGEAYA